MSEPARAAFALLRQSADRLHAADAFDLGRLLETRLLAAAGTRCGYFDAADVREWLSATDETVATSLDRISSADALSGMHTASEQLLELATPTEDNADLRAAFVQTLLLRLIADDDQLHQRVQRQLLFAAAEDWAEYIAAAITWRRDDRTSVRSPEARNYLDTVDGAVRIPVLAADALATSGVLDLPWGALWPRFDETADQGTGIPSRADIMRSTGVFRRASRFESREEFSLRRDAGTDRLILRARLWSWALIARQGDENARAHDPLLDLHAELLPPVLPPEIVMKQSPDLSWAALMWRIAPGDQRSRMRALDLVSLVSTV